MLIRILFVCFFAALFSLWPTAVGAASTYNQHSAQIEVPTPLRSPANGEGAFKVGLISVSVGAATLLVGSLIRWTSQEPEAKTKAGYIQATGLMLIGIPLGIAITTDSNGRVSARSSGRSRRNRRW